MAGDWIKVREDLRQDTAVLALAARLSLDEDTIVGKLHRFWSWASANTTDGKLPDVDCKTIDHIVDVAGFADALMNVKWLKRGKKRGLVIPKFGAHMSHSAKARAGEALRKARQRMRLSAKECPDTCPDSSGTRARAAESKEENRRKLSGNAGPLRFAPSEGPEPAAKTHPNPSRSELSKQLARVRHKGEIVFSAPTAANIALNPRATPEQVAWAIERFEQAASQRPVENAGGYLRHLIEGEPAPSAWIARHRRDQLTAIARCTQKQEQLIHERAGGGTAGVARPSLATEAPMASPPSAAASPLPRSAAL